MLRKILGLLFCLGLLMGSVSAGAAEETGSIGVMLDQAGEVTLYRVGEFTEAGYRLLDCYGGQELTFDQLLDPQLPTILAQEAADGTPRKSETGLVTWYGVTPGIYLLVQTDCSPDTYPFSPFLVTIPWDGDQWDVQINPQDAPPKTGQGVELFLAMGMMLVSGLGLAGCTLSPWKKRK